MAAEDWPRYIRWDAAQKQIAAVQQEVFAAQQRQQTEAETQFAEFAKREGNKFLELVPEMADPVKADALQKALISITTRDGQGFISTLDELGFFLPSVDLERLAEAQEEVLNQIWGRDLTQLAQPDPAEVRELSLRFKDILFEFPFQVPQNFIYLGRTLGILSGLSAMLNPEINPWEYIEKYGQRLIRSRRSKLFDWSNVMQFGQDILSVPIQLRRIVADLERGRVRVVARPNQRTEKQLDRIERQNRQLNATLLAVGGLVCGTLLYLNGDLYLGVGFWSVATLIGVGSLFRF